ncbi:MAG TPA: hypothetical protein VFV78_04960 [Vicinamibacterales bacterium]|nr:hypothetical protein [Vicinamibacterales bacterium]
MTCRSCGATIDAKAIICYRCGAPTADAAAGRSGTGAKKISNARIVLVVLAVLAVLVYLLMKVMAVPPVQ